MSQSASSSAIERAAVAIHDTEFLLYTAGAGMGVDSGLPDFRGNEGFWRAYPPLAKLGVEFAQMANPQWFERDPTLAWGFYGHRLNLYRATTPHGGFAVLNRWAQSRPARVYTSNVDGQFQRAGLSNVCEVHGSIHHLQCTKPCSKAIWSADDLRVEVDIETLRATSDLPRCPACGALARPNILMFWDGAWNLGRSLKQEQALTSWLGEIDIAKLAIVECGAGTGIPTVRAFGERLQSRGAQLIRINVRESAGPDGTIELAMGARDALLQIEQTMNAIHVRAKTPHWRVD